MHTYLNFIRGTRLFAMPAVVFLALAANVVSVHAAGTALSSGNTVSPTSQGTWTEVAKEWQYFKLGTQSRFSTRKYVRFGAGNAWVGKYLNGTNQCVSGTFGLDPAPGVTKVCQVYTADSAPTPTPTPPPPPPPPPPSNTAQLTWNAPSASVAGYRVYYGTASNTYSQSKGNGIYVTQPAYTVNSLTSGNVYYFAVTTIDTSGRESAYSNEVSKTFP